MKNELQTTLESKLKSTPKRTQEERRSEAECALLDAAEALIAKQGIVQTSLSQIGELAGYSRGLVNHHFGTKDALVDRLVRRSRMKFMKELRLDTSDSGLNNLLRAADTYLQIYVAKQKMGSARMVLWGAAFASGATHTDAVSEGDEEARKIICAGVQLGQDDGSVSNTVDGLVFAVMLLGMLRGIAGQILVGPSSLKKCELRSQVKIFIAASIGA
ncbi:MAG: AcrR family transcriptional regulator [Candidatus Azotimanducaceae bacterium]|jgi:AcrR family transcriptional regulator